MKNWNRLGWFALLICFGAMLGCDRVEEVVEAKNNIERLLQGDDRDVYKPIREGRIKLKPLANGPELMTWNKFYEQRYQWHLKTYVRNFEKFGHRSAVWDDKVKSMLAEYAVFRRERTSAAFMQNLLDQVDHILELGCKDARVISIKGILLYENQNAVDAAPYLKQGLELLEKSDYPKRYSYFVTSHLRYVYSGSRGLNNPYAAYQRAAMKYLGKAAQDRDYQDGHQRYYMHDFIQEFSNKNCCMPENAAVCMDEIIQSKQIDSWISQVARGYYHYAVGWKYRGDGYASTVAKENMNKFHKEIAEARKCLTQAHEIHPEFPEAAAKMVDVSMVIAADHDERLWLERTIAAHFDYLYAYDDLLNALRPRWGGSHDEMLKFGIECLNTGRFDTRVPSRFLVSLFQIGSEMDNWRIPYQWPGIYDLIKQYFDGLLSEPNNKDYYDTNKSFYAVVAWAAGQHQDAHRMMQELGSKFDHRAYSYLEVNEEEVLNEIKVHVR